MEENHRSRGQGKILLTALFLLTFIHITFLPSGVLADGRQETSLLVFKARYMLENFMTDNNLDAFHNLIKKAKAVFLIPDFFKGGFFFGGSGGNGLLLVADPKNGTWIGPAFFTVGGASFGLQIGGAVSETAILIMTEKGISSFLSSNFKMGADLGVAIGPVGFGAAVATANLSADLVSFSRSRGLYGGISLEGAVVAVRDDLNNAFYNKTVSPTDILIKREVRNPEATSLIEEAVKAAKK